MPLTVATLSLCPTIKNSRVIVGKSQEAAMKQGECKEEAMAEDEPRKGEKALCCGDVSSG